ncbi:imidazolonepropionase [soil metagenome]
MSQAMRITNLLGVFSGSGFMQRDGRRAGAEDAGFVEGPLDLSIDDRSGLFTDSPAGETFDAAGMLALPGFIDPHTHAIFAGERSHEYFMRWAGRSYVEIAQSGGGIHSTVRATNHATDAELASNLRARLKQMLRCGATTVEVKSGYADTAKGELRLLRLIKSLAHEQGLPEIRPTFLGLHALPKDRSEDDFVDEMISILPRIAEENLAAQVDAFPEKGFFTLESSLRFAEAAMRVGLPMKVHADELCDLGSSEAFAKFGALSIDHLQYISDSAVKYLGESRTVATMLPATSFFVSIPYAGARRLIDAGARVALATDFNPGTAPAGDLQLTHMLAASQMKMTAAEILCASTFNAAASLGLENTHGVIAPGRVGNVLLYEIAKVDQDLEPMAMLEQIILARNAPTHVVSRGRLIAS